LFSRQQCKQLPVQIEIIQPYHLLFL
jgi:hypothetical protein